MELTDRSGTTVFWGSCRCPVLPLGMEGSAPPDHPEWVFPFLSDEEI